MSLWGWDSGLTGSADSMEPTKHDQNQKELLERIGFARKALTLEAARGSFATNSDVHLPTRSAQGPALPKADTCRD
jgi:hypothetical protein